MIKIVFIAHPMSGDLEANMAKVVAICREIHSPDIIPLFPSALTRRYLTPNPEDRLLARLQIRAYFERRVPDELWLYGDSISPGMMVEVELAIENGIPVYGKSPETQEALAKRFHEDQ